MNKHRKLNKSNNLHEGALKKQLRNKRKRKSMKTTIILVAAISFLVLIGASLLSVMWGFANMVVNACREEDPSLIYSSESFGFMEEMYKPLENVSVVENSTDWVGQGQNYGGGYHHSLFESSTEIIEDVESEPTESDEPTDTEVEVDDSGEWKPVAVEPKPANGPYIKLTEEERRTFAILLYLEAGAEPAECQYACGSVVINRYTTGNHDSLLDVIYAKSQFSPAKHIHKYSPREDMLEIVDWLCENGPTIPEYVTYFRASHYHTWSTVEDWKMIEGNTNDVYFSYDPRLKAKWEEKHSAE